MAVSSPSTQDAQQGSGTPITTPTSDLTPTGNPPGATQTQLGVDPFGGGSAFGTSGLTQDTTAYTPNNASLADVPTSAFNTKIGAANVAANPYGAGTPQYNVFNDYVSSLGRAPNADEINGGVINSWAANPNAQAGIANSPEAQTSGRAANEITPQIQSQIQSYLNQAQTAHLQASQQLAALDPAFQQQYNQLRMGYNQNLNAQNQALSNLSQNYDVTSQRLGAQLGLIPQQAFAQANRRGMLDSSAAYETLARLALPVQNNLSDLTRSYMQNRSTAENQLSNIVQKYQADQGQLYGQRAQQTQSIQDQLALAYKQSQDQAQLAASQYAPQVAARAGSLGDLQREFGLQQQQVQGQIQNYQALQNLQQQQLPSQEAQSQAMANYFNNLARK